MLNLFDPKKSHAVRTHLQTAKAKLLSSAYTTTTDIDDVTSTTSNSDIKSVKTSSSVVTVSSNGTSPSRSVQRHTSSSTNRRRSLSTNGASQKDQQVCSCSTCNQSACCSVWHIMNFCCGSSATTPTSLVLLGCALCIWLFVRTLNCLMYLSVLLQLFTA
jgi:hypothetical protein